MNVLTFPGDWLLQEEREEQKEELSRLRVELLPCTVLLHSFLVNTGQHVKCLQLADLVAIIHLHIYQVYTKQSLRNLLATPR